MYICGRVRQEGWIQRKPANIYIYFIKKLLEYTNYVNVVVILIPLNAVTTVDGLSKKNRTKSKVREEVRNYAHLKNIFSIKNCFRSYYIVLAILYA